jgi:salicylate hydroxylase
VALSGRKATVIGGGVAGLAVARALALRGAEVRVLEQAPVTSEVGAGLQISPNGGRVLDALGLSGAFLARSTASAAVVLRDQAGRRVLRMPLEAQGRFALVHRADLIEVLEQGAREAGVTIELGARVAAVTLGERGAEVRLADGVDLRPELLVGADGIHSRVRAELEGDARPRFTGQVAWRAVIPCPEGVPAESQVFMGPGRHLVAYPLRDGALLNIVAVEERTEWAAEGWHHPGDPDELRAAFAGFAQPVKRWLAAVDSCMLWGLFRHPVAGRWHAPGVAMLGDAAHPTLPFLAQGACMALEDAWVLAHVLDTLEDEAAALEGYQRTRRPRVRRIVEAATQNARNYHLRGPIATLAHASLRTADLVAPQRVLARFDWLYGHDVTA